MKLFYYYQNVKPVTLPDGMIFVFGSNLAGIHGAGAAKDAKQYFGAKQGVGFGLQGQSFAIPTKDHRIKTLDIDYIYGYVEQFIKFAKERDDLTFFVTRIGCGLAGYQDHEMASLFETAPENCYLSSAWLDYIPYREPIPVPYL